jgi:hypothetical protein
MNSTEARRQAERFFSQPSSARAGVDEYEARSRAVQQKMEYLRRLRLSVQARQTEDLTNSG